METEPRLVEAEGKKTTHKIGRKVLDLFWILAERENDDRSKAAENLVKRLSEAKSQNAEVYASQLNYCLDRLVRGLASSRKFARVGYAVALTKILREMKDVKIKQVLEIIKKELSVSAHEPKSDAGCKFLGRVFAYGAICQSERELKEDLGTIVQELLSLSSKKSYIRPTCTQTLVDLIGVLTPKDLRESVWPHLKEDLDKGWVECTPDRLLLLLAFNKKDKSLVTTAYLKKHWGADKILDKENFENVLHLLNKSVEMPLFQPMLVDAICKKLTRKKDNPDTLKQFWTKVGNPLLATTVPRKQLALALFTQLLERKPDLTVVESMLFPALAGLMCRVSNRKDDPLMDACAKIESLLVQICKDKGNSETVYPIVTKFVQSCYQQKAYGFIGSNTFSTLCASLEGKAVKEFATLCMQYILGKEDVMQTSGEDEGEKAGGKRQRELSLHLIPLLRIAAVNLTMQHSDLALDILQFLLLHYLFKVTKATKNIPHCGSVSEVYDPILINMFGTTFHRTLMQLLSMRPDRKKEDQQLLKYVSILSDLAQYTQKLLSSPNIVEPRKEISKEVHQEWKKVIEVVTKSGKKSQGTKMEKEETFNLLILHLAFELFKEPETTAELLEDIYVCLREASKNQKAKQKDEGEPEWIEVTTEILLSMMSRASKWARKTTVTVFKALTPHLTPSAVHLITQVLKDDKSKKEDLFEFEDAKKETNGKENNDTNDEENEEEDDSSEDEEMPIDDDTDGEEIDEDDDDSETDDSDDDDDDNDDEEVDEKLRESVKKALGSAAVGSDTEEEDKDLKDSEMFALDEQLSAAFRAMRRPTKKEKTEKLQEVANFRVRVLDFVEVIVESERCGDFALELLVPLLELVVLKFKGQKLEANKQLCNKAQNIFQKLCRQRNLVDHIHSNKQMRKVGNKILQMALKGHKTELSAELANGCLCVLRLLSGQTEAPDSSKTGEKKDPPSTKGQTAFVNAIQKVLQKDLMNAKTSKYNRRFFSAMVEKYPSVFWPLVSNVLTALKSDDVKVHKKTQACALLVQLLHSNTRKSLTDEVWSSFFSSVSPVLQKLVMSQQKDDLKRGLMKELLEALAALSRMTTLEERKLMLTKNLFAHLAKMKGAFNKDTRKVYGKLTQPLNQQGKKKKGKKRKANDTPQNGVPEKKKKAEEKPNKSNKNKKQK